MDSGTELVITSLIEPSIARAAPPHPNEAARFERLVDSGDVSAGTGFYYDAKPAASYSPEVDGAMRRLSSIGAEMSGALNYEPAALPASADFELHVMHAVFQQQRHFQMQLTKFEFGIKVIDSSLKGVQTLYKMQG